MMNENYEDYDDDEFLYEDRELTEYELLVGECGQVVEGGVIHCLLAGSEHCDWDCPLNGDIGKSVDELEDELEITEDDLNDYQMD